jgi:hypothetical protein
MEMVNNHSANPPRIPANAKKPSSLVKMSDQRIPLRLMRPKTKAAISQANNATPRPKIGLAIKYE